MRDANRAKDSAKIDSPVLGARETQQSLESDAVQGEEEILSSHYVILAVKAWQRGELSEGQLARKLRTDRLGAREIIQEFERSEHNPGAD
jgi:ribosome-binding protein aMBF1 (putative translation factor)